MDLRRLLTSCFGLGFIPAAPGTFGSLAAAAIFWILAINLSSRLALAAVMVLLIFYGSLVTLAFSIAAVKAAGKKDPSEIVSDELAGQALAFAVISPFFSNACFAALAGFLLFRFFDIVKPGPVRKLEQLPGGWGILADDLLAGLMAGLTLALAAAAGALHNLEKAFPCWG